MRTIHLRIVAGLLGFGVLTPFAMGESTVTSTVDQSVRTEVNGVVQEESNHWTNSDANAMRPYGSVMESHVNSQLSVQTSCSNLQGTTHLSCIRDVRRILNSQPETPMVKSYTDTQPDWWIQKCQESVGTNVTACNANGMVGRAMERRSHMNTLRQQTLFERLMKRLQRQLGLSGNGS